MTPGSIVQVVELPRRPIHLLWVQASPVVAVCLIFAATVLGGPVATFVALTLAVVGACVAGPLGMLIGAVAPSLFAIAMRVL